MSKLKGYQITDQYVTVNYDGQTHIVPRTEALADALIKALREGQADKIPDLVVISKRIKKFSNGNFVIKDGKVLVNGQEAPKVLGDKIFRFSSEGLPFQPLVKFAEKLQRNPSFRAVNELFGFLEKNNHPITEEGNFIAYKRVRGTFKDIHSNTFDNTPGTTVEINRNQVDEDSSVTCSRGLHVANWDYAHNHFASSDSQTDIMLEVEVDPADVVAIPADYNNAKIRVCKYKVLGVVDSEHSSDTSLRVTNPSYTTAGSYASDEDEDEDEEYTCEDCGEETDGQDLCDDCDYERDQEYEDEEEEEEEDEDNDEYPWKDELNE